MAGYGEGGPGRVGTPAFIAARDNDPTRGALQGAAATPRVLSVQPWDVAPIPTATNFFAKEAANLLLGGNAGDTVTTTLAGGGAVQLPRNAIASIQAIVWYCNAPALTTSISYTVRASGSPIPGLTNLGFPPQTAAYINQGFPGPFNVIYAGAYIDVLITRVVTDVANLVNFTLIGWFNSPQDVQRWTGATPGQV